jgi:hypothetical protein
MCSIWATWLSIRLLWSQHAACKCAQFERLSIRLLWSQHTACSLCSISVTFPLGCCDHSIPRVAVLNFSDFLIRLLWSQHTVHNSDNGKETLNHCRGAWEFLNLIRVYNKELTFTSPPPPHKKRPDRQTDRQQEGSCKLAATGKLRW